MVLARPCDPPITACANGKVTIWLARIASIRWRLAFLCLLLAVAALAGLIIWLEQAAERDPFQASAIADAPFPSLTYAVQAFLWWDENHAGKSLDLVRLMSFSHVKQVFAWRDLEPIRGEWHWSAAERILDAAERRELKLVARLGGVPAWARPESHGTVKDGPPLDLARWAGYCEKVAQRFAGRVAAYQIWNEPNLSREWGGDKPEPAAYVELLAACSKAIRRVDPQAILISAGLAPPCPMIFTSTTCTATASKRTSMSLACTRLVSSRPRSDPTIHKQRSAGSPSAAWKTCAKLCCAMATPPAKWLSWSLAIPPIRQTLIIRGSASLKTNRRSSSCAPTTMQLPTGGIGLA
ncbi:MAG: hypothetical protein F4063_06530 [Chloroflexi bacterium]|nr:hypothetical protein [Chloroflexota bacterium]